MTGRALGKKPYVPNPRAFKAARYLTPASTAAPGTMNWSAAVTSWPMFANDRVGDCTCAAAGHMVELWTATGQHDEASVTDTEVLAAYSAITGYDPNNPSTDNGAQISDVLSYWHHSGIAGHQIGAYLELDITNHDQIRAAISLFGGVNVGLQLPAAAQNFTAPQWPNPPQPPTGPWAPGSWGGHCVPLVDYTTDGPTAVSWGELYVMTWEFWDAYGEEAWAVVSTDFLTAGKDPDGFDLAALNADLAALHP